MDNVYIYLIDLPTKIHEMVTPCADGYTVYINARLSPIGQEEAYNHAIWHIDHHDFEKGDVQEIEHEANGNIYASQHRETGKDRRITGIPKTHIDGLHQDSF